jgi:hypothetical protein
LVPEEEYGQDNLLRIVEYGELFICLKINVPEVSETIW